MKISIITPLYKGNIYIKNLLSIAVDNAKNVREDEIEYILVNDSPWQIIKPEEYLTEEVERTDNLTVRLIENEKNSGIHKTRVNGLIHADGEFVMFLDQDDSISSDAVAVFLHEYRKKENEHIDVLVANGVRKREDEEAGRKLYTKKSVYKLIGREKTYLKGTDMIFSPGQCMIRKESIPDKWYQDILDENGCDDLLLWLLMLNEKCVFKGIEKELYIHTETDCNYSNSSQLMTDSYNQVCNILEANKEYPDKKVRQLRRRYALKLYLKSDAPLIKKLVKMAGNLDIMLACMNYKLKGYY